MPVSRDIPAALAPIHEKFFASAVSLDRDVHLIRVHAIRSQNDAPLPPAGQRSRNQGVRLVEAGELALFSCVQHGLSDTTDLEAHVAERAIEAETRAIQEDVKLIGRRSQINGARDYIFGRGID